MHLSPQSDFWRGNNAEALYPRKLKIEIRKEIRDVFDIEFLYRRGVNLSVDYEELKKIKEIIQGFKKRDYYVTLGSLLDDDTREYYKKNKFSYLLSIIDEALSYK